MKNCFFLVVKNLIDNSFKYTNDNWKIEIFLTEKSFKIIDNWVWISKSKLDNIFNNFYRESSDDKWYWIWLNIVKKIIDLLNYKISIKSKKWFWSEFEINFY
jgi:K+-sensing histidine kinase KdpD